MSASTRRTLTGARWRGGGAFDQIIFQLSCIKNLRIFDRQQDVMLLNAGFFRRVGYILHRDHVNPGF